MSGLGCLGCLTLRQALKLLPDMAQRETGNVDACGPRHPPEARQTVWIGRSLYYDPPPTDRRPIPFVSVSVQFDFHIVALYLSIVAPAPRGRDGVITPCCRPSGAADRENQRPSASRTAADGRVTSVPVMVHHRE